MALLVDKLDDFTFVPLGPIIVKRLHDLNWEVRDSALELLTSISDIAYCSKYIKIYNIYGIILS